MILISPLLEVNDSRLVSTVDSVLQHGGQFVKHIEVLAQSLAFLPLVDVLTLVKLLLVVALQHGDHVRVLVREVEDLLFFIRI